MFSLSIYLQGMVDLTPSSKPPPLSFCFDAGWGRSLLSIAYPGNSGVLSFLYSLVFLNKNTSILCFFKKCFSSSIFDVIQ